MFAKKSFLGSIFPVLVSSLSGMLAMAAWMAAFAYWMVEKNTSASAAMPMAFFALCFGGFFSGWILSNIKKERGLLNGLLQGVMMNALFLGYTFLYGAADHTAVMMRFAAVLLSGIVGGVSGMLLKSPKRRL